MAMGDPNPLWAKSSGVSVIKFVDAEADDTILVSSSNSNRTKGIDSVVKDG